MYGEGNGRREKLWAFQGWEVTRCGPRERGVNVPLNEGGGRRSKKKRTKRGNPTKGKP